MYKYVNLSGDNFSNDIVWYTIVVKVSAFCRKILISKLADVTLWSKILSLIQITIIIEVQCFLFS